MSGARDTEASFLSGDGEMARLIRTFDWSSSLGPVAEWPQSLKTVVGLMINSKTPLVLLWGVDGIMIYNDAYSVFAGGRHPELLGSRVRDGWPEVADFNDNVMRVGLAGGTLSYQDQELTLYRTGQPEQVWMNLDYSPVPDETGKPAGVIAIVVETTARVKADALARASEARYRDELAGEIARQTERLHVREAQLRTVFETSHLYQGLLTADGILREANETSLQAIEASAEDVLGKPFWATPWFTGTPGMPEVVRAAIEAVAAGGSVAQQMTLDLPTGRRSYEFSMRPVCDPEGRVVAIVPEAVEITARLLAEEALRQSQKMEAMGQLTGGVAHDFNNLLTPIIGSLDMLQAKRLGGAREQRMIDGALQAAERAKVLVQRLLAFARRQPLSTEPVDIGDLVRDMSALIASTSGPRIRVEVEVENDLALAEADPNQVEMALLNLSVNARDAMPDGGRLTLAARTVEATANGPLGLAPGRYVRLSVSDTGHGMDEAVMARAVEPFFSTKGIGKGTGLGLSMVHGLAAQLGGALEIQSRPKLGTSVSLWLPVSAAKPAAGDGERAEPVAAPAGCALLVDDEALAREATCEMLAELGYRVLQAESAESALALLKDGRAVDVVITDHLMPGMTGTELAEKVRALGVPVLLISGYADVESIAPTLPRLTKPFRQAELSSALGRLTLG